MTSIHSIVNRLKDVIRTVHSDKIDSPKIEGRLDQYKSIHLFQDAQRKQHEDILELFEIVR